MPDREQFSSATEYNEAFVEEFRANGGEVTGPMAGRQVLILTTTGAKSGREHRTPLVYMLDGDRYNVSGANGGSDKHPDWYYNLLKNPIARLELPGESFEVVAHVAVGDERDRLHERRLIESVNYRENVPRTTRRIPLIIFERREASTS